MIKMIAELEAKRQEVLGTIYDKEKSDTERSQIAAEYDADLSRLNQLRKMKRIKNPATPVVTTPEAFIAKWGAVLLPVMKRLADR